MRATSTLLIRSCAMGSLLMAGVLPMAAAAASLGCVKPSGPADKLVCADPQLRRMNGEVVRLTRLAYADRRAVVELRTDQASFLRTREQCGVGSQARRCLAAAFAERVYQLRQGSAAARSADSKGISDGPIAYRCKGLNALIAATYVNADPGVVHLEWLDQKQTLMQAQGGSGARYTAKNRSGVYSFWTQGKEALFQMPGSKELRCNEEPQDD